MSSVDEIIEKASMRALNRMRYKALENEKKNKAKAKYEKRMKNGRRK